MDFMSAIKRTLDNTSITENGAIGFSTTGSALVDLNFAVPSLRKMSNEEVAKKFMRAFYEDQILAMKWLFYARDVRGGLGERRLFRVVLEHLAKTNSEIIISVINLIPEYGRWDDLWCLLNCENEKITKTVQHFVREQFIDDCKNMAENKPISLLAKWLSSENASSKQTKKNAKILRESFGLSPKDYRKILSVLREYLNIVEVKMSAKNWSEINYEAVPSRANLIYWNAFLKNDTDRRKQYLDQLKKDKVKINASTLFPHDVVHKYNRKYEKDEALEALWRNLPNTIQNCENTIVIADGSGSMQTSIDFNSRTTALEVANALAIYFAERSSGQFKDKYITFSERPQFVDLSSGNSLRDKLNIAEMHDEVANTNIEAVFDLILTTAINNQMRQEDLPKNILIVSDMEFDRAVVCNIDKYDFFASSKPTKQLFKVISEKYEQAGYKLPRLIFWNVNSRTNTIPVKENDLGVALVSGFSVNIAKMVMSNKLDPYECLLETINSERYAPVEKTLNTIMDIV